MEKYVAGFKKFMAMLTQGDIKHNADTFICGVECCPEEFGLDNGKKTFCDKGDCSGCWQEALGNLAKPTMDSAGECCLFGQEERHCEELPCEERSCLDCNYNRHGSADKDYTSMCTASGKLVWNGGKKACENFKG